MEDRALTAWFGGLLPDVQADALANLVSGIADMAILVRPDGTITDLRGRAELDGRLGLSDWSGSKLQGHLTSESVPKLERCLEKLNGGATVVSATELNHPVAGDARDLPMSYSFHRIDKGHNLLMLGRDLRPVAEMQQQIVAAQVALEREYEVQRDTDTRLRVLMTSTPEACLFVNVVRREVIEANSAAITLFGLAAEAFPGASVDDLLRAGKGGDLVEGLVAAATGQQGGKVSARTGDGGTEVEISPVSFRMSGAHTLLCRVVPRDAGSSPGGTMEARLGDLYAGGPDAIVFVARDGKILSANDSFLDLADVAQEQGVRGRSLADFLNRGGIDMSVLLDNAERSGTLRMFATKIVKSHGPASAAEMSVTRIGSGAETVFGLVIRDTSRVDAVRAQVSTDAVEMGSVVDLIGKQSLRDIVARTTDVIEKMCIEAAVELTSNNRLAAADMLGLSRQSLYVKLRKYDLLKRDDG